jgi:GT2 family glycosyltransferase
VCSVTPFSNNATICSYPNICEDNPLPAGWTVGELDRAFASANRGQVLEVPTAVGFCMYVRRDCLREVGLFDMDLFGKGYGEENDFCLRAADAGWRNLHALDVFVRHTGGASFGASKPQRELEAMVTLRQLYPEYERQVHAYIALDPPAAARARATVACASLGGKSPAGTAP